MLIVTGSMGKFLQRRMELFTVLEASNPGGVLSPCFEQPLHGGLFYSATPIHHVDSECELPPVAAA